MIAEPPLPTQLPDLQRLRWQCRRGLLELDILLSTFLENNYAALSELQKADFVQLLNYSDQQLLHWFTDQETIPENLRSIISLVRPQPTP